MLDGTLDLRARFWRYGNTAMVAGVFQSPVGERDHAPFSANVLWRTGVAGRIIGGDHDGVADFEFADGVIHNFAQSGRTLGISGSTCAASRSRNCAGSSA